LSQPPNDRPWAKTLCMHHKLRISIHGMSCTQVMTWVHDMHPSHAVVMHDLGAWPSKKYSITRKKVTFHISGEKPPLNGLK